MTVIQHDGGNSEKPIQTLLQVHRGVFKNLPKIYNYESKICFLSTSLVLSSVLLKKGVLNNFANFTGKHLYWSLFLINSKNTGLQPCNFIKKRLQHRCFPVKFVKFLRTAILKYICERLLLTVPQSGRNTTVRKTYLE